MSRRRSEESSLDLLLDAMCNTFGGVMFIAILLTVMISIRGLEKKNAVPDQNENIEVVRQQAAKLQNELDELMKKTDEQAKLLENMKADPRLRLVHEIALMERMYREKLLSQKMALQKVNLSRSILKNLEVQTMKAVADQQKTEKQLKGLLAMVKKKKTILADLNKKIGSAQLKNLVFVTMVKKEDIPYFIFVNNGKIWPVGPEINGKSYTPNPAVTYQVKDRSFLCSPIPEKGISIFTGKELAPEFRNFMKGLPAGRIPEFVISKSDAPDFYRLREILKKQNVFHGFLMEPDDRDFFAYQFANRADKFYEY
ncbi:MAG: hypothetical protein E7055_00630 [Lentisphaerae bacterium]|nr:hypothetical protein [Lentisphaerota bacterium]